MPLVTAQLSCTVVECGVQSDAADGICVLAAGKHDWALQPQQLQEAMEKDVAAGLIPCYLCATVGTTSSAAVDPLQALGTIAQQYGVWCGQP